MTKCNLRKSIRRRQNLILDFTIYNKLKPFVIFRINQRWALPSKVSVKHKSSVVYLYDKKKVRYLLLTNEQRLNPDLNFKYIQFVKAKRDEIVKMINETHRVEILVEADTLKEAREKLMYEEFLNLL